MTDNVFAQTEGQEVEGTTSTVETSPLAELLGEDKKFKTIDDLAKGKLEADKFIEQLQGELKATREQMAELEDATSKSATVTDLVAAVKNANKQVDAEGNQPISEEQLQGMVESIMEGRHEKQTRLANFQQANQAVLDKFNGDVEAARAYTAERARQLGLPVDKLRSLGEESPSAFRQLMETKPSTGSQSVAALPEVNVDRGSNPNRAEVIDGHHTKAYYDKLKKDLGPAKYWNDTKIQGQYFKDAEALRDRFNN
jgi:hypothetical protein